MQNELKRIFDFDIKWEIKEFNEPLQGGIPLVSIIATADKKELTFAEISADFEKTHCKITNTGMFVKKEVDKDIVMTKTHLITSYEHMTYTIVDKGEKKQMNFISKWLRDNPNIQIKREIAIFPDDLLCPDDIYNAWRPFKMNRIENFEQHDDAVDTVQKHIEILCNHDKYAYDYMILWISALIQFPSRKLPMPVFVSAEGAGKGSLLRLLSSLLGASKILQTQEPSKEVWGEFNSLMLNAYLVCLDEISKKEMSGCEGKIKGLVTEPTIRINDKGKSRFEVPSYHKFIAFSNPDQYGNEPMNTTSGDRRKFFIECSDELVRNTEYFDKFYKMLDDIDSMKSVFEYFNNMEEVEAIFAMKLPETEYNKSLKEMATPPLKSFLIDHFTDSWDTEISNAELYKQFKDWTERTGVRYECNNLQFACRIARMKLKGMEKLNNIGEKYLKGWSFDCELCREELGMNA
jgi:hypothetical protein